MSGCYGVNSLEWDELRRQVERRRGREIPDDVFREIQREQWFITRGLNYEEDVKCVLHYLDENDLDQLPTPEVRKVSRALDGMEPVRSEVMRGPREWRERSAAILEGFRPLQATARALVTSRRGLAPDGGPFDPRDLEWLLVSQAAKEPRQGDRLDLCFGMPPDERSAYLYSSIDVYRGYRVDEYLDRLEGWGPAQLERDAKAWRDAMSEEYRLATIVDMAMQIVRMTRCDQWQAVNFLLCDEPFEMPWIRVDRWQGAGDGWITIRANVGANRDELCKAFSEAKRGRRTRRMQDQTLRLLDFIDEHPELGRKLQLELWNEEPGVKPYKSVSAFITAISEARRRLGPDCQRKRHSDRRDRE